MASPTASRALAWAFLGRVGYREALALQLGLREALKRGAGGEHLLLLEHPHVYTLGRSAVRGDVLADPDWLDRHGVTVEECDRGGQVTYHGPGQLVGYPIVNLSPDRRDVRRYVGDLQEALIRTLAGFGIAARVRPGQEHVGVWVGDAKIASLGVHLSRWITTHGFALNVSTDLSYFSGIVPCGLAQVRMTSIARELAGDPARGAAPFVPSLAEVAATVAEELAAQFCRRLVPAALPGLRLLQTGSSHDPVAARRAVRGGPGP